MSIINFMLNIIKNNGRRDVDKKIKTIKINSVDHYPNGIILLMILSMTIVCPVYPLAAGRMS